MSDASIAAGVTDRLSTIAAAPILSDRSAPPVVRLSVGDRSPRLLGFWLAVALACFSTGSFAEPCPVAYPNLFLDSKGVTAPPTNGLPSPPTNNDCGFYNWAWRTFMFVTETTASKDPRFFHYQKIDDVFPAAFGKTPTQGESAKGDEAILALSAGKPTPRSEVDSRRPHGSLSMDDGVRQASYGDEGEILVDQRGNPVFYSINLNDDYANFIHDNHIDDIPRLLTLPIKDQDNGAIPADLEFRPGALELKSSWMIIEGPVSAYSNYIVARAKAPVFTNAKNSATGKSHVVVDVSKPLRDVNVAMLGLHIVGVIDGHPEFVWATFEHADARGERDIAPAADVNPDLASSSVPRILGSNHDYSLFRAGTIADKADDPVDQPIGADQKFSARTSVYRMFPGSQSTKPNDGEAAAPWEDPAVYNLNESVTALFDRRDPDKADLRRNYRLVGAAWIDQPRAIPQADAQGDPLPALADGTQTLVAADGKVSGGVDAKIARNFDAGLTFDVDDPRLAGENRLSNMSLESFTQSREMAPHCFSCHNTAAQEAGLNGKTLWARRINMSHVISIAVKAYLARVQPSAATAVDDCEKKHRRTCVVTR